MLSRPIVVCLLALATLFYGCEDGDIESDPSISLARNSVTFTFESEKLVAPDGAPSDRYGYSVEKYVEDYPYAHYNFVGADGDNSHTGAVYYYHTADGDLSYGGKIVPNGVGASDFFGTAIAAYEKFLAVGAPGDDDEGASAGAVYIFERNSAEQYELVQKITAPDSAPVDYFGYRLDISSDTLVVSSVGDDDGGNFSGSVYIFNLNTSSNQWEYYKKLVASDGQSLDFFGRAIAMTSSTIAVGTPGDDDNGSGSGSVYLYSKNQGGSENWGLVQKLHSSDNSSADKFGTDVSINDSWLVVGAEGNNISGLYSGSAYLFEETDPGNWQETEQFVPGDGAPYDRFGFKVSLSSDNFTLGHEGRFLGVVITAPGDEDNGSASGSAYVFTERRYPTYHWVEEEKLTANDGQADDFFGISAVIGQDNIWIGAHQDDDNGTDSGSVYTFDVII